MSGSPDDDPPGRDGDGDEPDDGSDEPRGWSPDDESEGGGTDEESNPGQEGHDHGHGHDDEGGGHGSDDEQDAAFPAIAVDVPAPLLAARAVLRVLFASFVFAAGSAGYFLGRSALVAETTALLALTLGALALPAWAVLRRVRRYPERGRFQLDRRGFKIPWLGREAPGPEGPWEALRGYEVREGPRTGRVLVLEVAAGRFALSDRLLGREAFALAVEVLERALGPDGVLLGTVLRLPLQPHDSRAPLERARPKVVALGVAAAFVALATVASGTFVKVVAGFAAFLAIVLGNAALAWGRAPGADLVLALDGIVVPLLPDLRRTVKLPFSMLRRGAVEDRGAGPVLLIEHARGKLQYPLEWFDPVAVRDFARELARRTGSS